MLRQCCRPPRGLARLTCRRSVPHLLFPARLASTGQSGLSAGTKLGGLAVALTVGAVGGGLGYCALDDEFRATVEESVPGSDQVLDLVLGERTPARAPTPPLPSKLNISSPIVFTEAEVEVLSEKETSCEGVANTSQPAAVEADVATNTVTEGAAGLPPLPPLPPLPDLPKIEAPNDISTEKISETEESIPDDTVSSSEVKITEVTEEKGTSGEVDLEPTEGTKPDEAETLVEVAVEAATPVEVPVEAATPVEVPVEAATPAEVPVEAAIPVEVTTEAETTVEVATEPQSETEMEPQKEAEVASADVNEATEVPAETVEDSTEPKSATVEDETVQPYFSVHLEDGAGSEQTNTHDIENDSLEAMLISLCLEMEESVSKFVEDNEASSDAVVNHVSLMQKVLDSNISIKDDAAWNEMLAAAKDKSNKERAAENSEKSAMVTIANVVEGISAGRKNNITFTNPFLTKAEEAANKAIFMLDQAKARKIALLTEAKVMEEYRELVEAGREQFHKEMASIMPDVKLGETGKLTDDELNMFITHAYKKVLCLQQELARQKTLEQEIFKKSLEKAKTEIEDLALLQTRSELEQQSKELQAEYEKKVADLKLESEAELRTQLRRQAAAHSDHIADALAVQDAELTRRHKHTLDDQLAVLKREHQASLAALAGQAAGLAAALEARAGSDAAALAAQSLWLACNNLNSAVQGGAAGAAGWEDRLRPLSSAVQAVSQLAAEDQFVQTVLLSISQIALSRGVYTEDILKERFLKVERVARRVAGVGKEGGSLVTFALSYLQSVLLLDLTKRAPSEAVETVDPTEISPYEALSLARHSLDRGNLARAVQLLTLLEGEAGRVVRDWLQEARTTLETRQAVQTVMAHSLLSSCNHLPA